MAVQALAPALISPVEYLRREAKAAARSEYVRGAVCEMAGASRNHVEIQAALGTEIGAALRGKPCRILGPNTKLWIATTGSYYYPDATISCPPNYIDETNGVIDETTVVVEVLSPGTRSLDRGPKFADYRTLPTLKDYVLIDSERRRIEVFGLQEGEWMVRAYEEGVAALPSVGIALDLDALYRHTTV